MKKLSYVFYLVLGVFLFSCERITEEYQCNKEVCIDGYEEEYWTSGNAVSTSKATSRRKKTRWVCTKYRTDTVTCTDVSWKWKK
jgi:hypothetical protein